ncbi:hypothetical protein P3T76_015087 [Phytophthora citrophthora]|uniref:Uncharacterized protein n=1 Tax=Phytophthora citrophthora TaxID=4793 RepID=A0AAD9G0A7_9STRA|nr:hypothetical protein P3T76_015087 [Phytophthora citrophthora]
MFVQPEAGSLGSPGGSAIRLEELPACMDDIRFQIDNQTAAFSVTSTANDLAAIIDYELSDQVVYVYVYGLSYGTYLVEGLAHFAPASVKGFSVDGIVSESGDTVEKRSTFSNWDHDVGVVASRFLVWLKTSAKASFLLYDKLDAAVPDGKKRTNACADSLAKNVDTVIFVPSDYLSEAETLLKEALREDDHFTFNKEQELILLDTESYKSVRSIMQTIADKYNGSMAIQAEVHTREIKEQEHKYKLHAKDSEHEYKLRIKDLESMIEVLKERIQNAVADEKAKATVLLSKLEQRLAARDIQLIEEKGKVSMLQQGMTNKVSMLQQEMTNKVSMLQQEMTNKVSMIQQQSTSKLENMELRQKIAAIEHAAEIKEKDRLNGELRARIHELEETNRRLSKNFPEAA